MLEIKTVEELIALVKALKFLEEADPEDDSEDVLYYSS